jgi:hypothetical protein
MIMLQCHLLYQRCNVDVYVALSRPEQDKVRKYVSPSLLFDTLDYDEMKRMDESFDMIAGRRRRIFTHIFELRGKILEPPLASPSQDFAFRENATEMAALTGSPSPLAHCLPDDIAELLKEMDAPDRAYLSVEVIYRRFLGRPQDSHLVEDAVYDLGCRGDWAEQLELRLLRHIQGNIKIKGICHSDRPGSE